MQVVSANRLCDGPVVSLDPREERMESLGSLGGMHAVSLRNAMRELSPAAAYKTSPSVTVRS